MISRRSNVGAVRMSIAGVAVALCVLGGCGVAKPISESSKPDHYVFLVGPDASWSDGVDRRLLITMPSRFIELSKSEEKLSPVPVGQFNFAVRFPDGSPMERDQLGNRDVIVVTATWGKPGNVKRRVDGTLLNHYSRYGHTIDPMYDMQVSLASDGSDESRLLVSEDQDTLIECRKQIGQHAQACEMISDTGSYLTIESHFDPSLLPRWREVLALCRQLVADVKPYKDA